MFHKFCTTGDTEFFFNFFLFTHAVIGVKQFYCEKGKKKNIHCRIKQLSLLLFPDILFNVTKVEFF